MTPSSSSPPGAPTNVNASAATRQALVSWNEPSTNGGSAIAAYRITPYAGTVAQPATEAPGSVTSAIVKNLVNGVPYTFTVAAINATETGPPSTPSAAVTPQDTIFDFSTPSQIDSGDTSAVELGVKFSSEVTGTVTGIRFYKSGSNTGTHVGSLWTAGGELLASATFTGESTSGWQQVSFSKAVPITANTTYVAGYYAPKGRYSSGASGLATAVSNPPLSAISNAVSVNGVYSYAPASAFPTSTFKASNYYVDVNFVPTPVPGPVTNVTASAAPETATVSWSAPTEGGPVSEYKVTPYIGSEAQAPLTLTGSPPVTKAVFTSLHNGTSYTFRVQGFNGGGPGPLSAPSNAVTPAAPTVPSAPLAVGASAATSQARVSWSEPSSNGGSPLTGYVVTPYVGSSAQTPVTVSAGATATVVKGLSNGTSYTFTVKAVNAIGTGPASSALARGRPHRHAVRLRRTRGARRRHRRRHRGGRQVQRRTRRHDHRHPLLQGRRQHRHPRRQPVERRRRHCSPRPPSPARAAPAGSR